MAPLRDGEVIEPEAFSRLPAADQERMKAEMVAIQQELQDVLGELPREARRHREEMRRLDRLVTASATSNLVDEVRARWADVPAVLEFLADVEKDVVDSAEDFLPAPEGAGAVKALLGGRGEKRPTRRHQVNVLVTQSSPSGAPVVYEDHPTHSNLVGRIEHVAELGNLVTDFTLIQAGALHRANGGYLIVDARRLLLQPLAWDALKRALRSKGMRIESIGQALSLTATASLEPEPIPLEAKVVLLGERSLYYMLSQLDPEFPELFKVAADFEEEIERTGEGEQLYARLLGTFARREGLRPLDRGAVARAIEQASRRAADAERLQVHAETVADLLREADHLAGESGQEVVSAGHVQAALDAQVRRASRVRERIQEDIRRGTLLIETSGEAVGQVNGLVVCSSAATPSAGPAGSPPGRGWATATWWTSRTRWRWAARSTPRVCSSSRASSGSASPPSGRSPSRPASSSSSPTAASRATAPRAASSWRSSRPWARCPSGRDAPSPAR